MTNGKYIELKFRYIMRSTPFIIVGAWWVVKIGTSDSEKHIDNCNVKKACNAVIY